MKKIVKLFGVMTIAAALLISCKPSTEDPDAGTNSDTNTEQTAGTGAGTENTGNTGNDATGDGAGAAGAEEKPEDVVLTADENGNIAMVSTLEEYLAKYDTITIIIKNEGEDNRSGWGVLKLMATDAESPYTWHDGILSEGQYGQLPPPSSFQAGEEYSYKFTLSTVVDALKAEATAKSCTLKHQLTAQASNNAVLKSVVVSKK
ncbi:MAG: hypothetical protein MJ185_11980 [Treponema sp.]|nr:hypothetical protein [Treponema sp.]